MKIEIIKDNTCTETEVSIRCNAQEKNVSHIVETLKVLENRLMGYDRNGAMIPISLRDIFYLEAVERKVFVYLAKEVYEIKHRLFELEELLPEMRFFRISKSMIVNISKIRSLEPDQGRRLKIILENEEVLSVSRQYVKKFKEKLGIKGGKQL